MRITHVCLTGPVTDGWNYQDNLLPKYQVKNGHDVTMITSKWIWSEEGKKVYFDKTNYYNEDGVKMIRLEMKGKANFDKKIKSFYNLYETVESTDPDILFIHGVSFKDNTVLARFLKKHASVIAYADNHVDYSNSATNWLSENILHKVIWKYYAQKLVPYVKYFYGVLPARVVFLRDVYRIPKEKCKLLIMGADDELVEKSIIDKARDTVRKQYGIKEDDFLIITGGKIDQWKPQTLLLMKAINQIDNNRLKLIVFGSLADELKVEFNNLLSERVTYIGWIESRKSYDLFSSANLVVFPGRHSVFWEQVAGQGIPMIVKYWDGTTHIDHGGNVIFLYSDSEKEIVDSIMNLLNDKKSYLTMMQKAQSVKKDFLYSEIAKQAIEEE